MTLPRHEIYTSFVWKRVTYDSENRRFTTYRCERCSEELTHDDATLTEFLAAHEDTCASTQADPIT